MILSQFISQHVQEHFLPTRLGGVLESLAQACIAVSTQVRQGALADVLGSAGTDNIQGEVQQKLDIVANRLLIDVLQNNPDIAGLASEEEAHFISCNENGDYLVLFDPLDGSSNIDVNISVGTIFSILPKPSGTLCTASFLQQGHCQVGSGYVLYGPQTQLVFTLKHGVFAFTLDSDSRFRLSQSNLTVPEQTQEFAINMSNSRYWFVPVRQYIEELLLGDTGVRGKNYNMRWIASMVAEIHRILMRGGVFMYPRDTRVENGKLRLMYEANPLGLLLEQAGGAASNGLESMLAIQPESLHQRVAVVMGSREEVAYINRLHGG